MNYRVNFQKAKRNYIVLTFDDEREENGEVVEYEKTLCFVLSRCGQCFILFVHYVLHIY